MPNATDALAGLRDIHLPEAVSFWPPAPGWWLALLLLIVLVGAGLAVGRWRRASIRRAALRELAALERDCRGSGDSAPLAAGVSALLRRFALARHPRSEVAALHGAARAEFLARSARRGFPAALAESLERAVYAGPVAATDAAEGEAWVAAARRWIGRFS